jgi:hypothetical protein
MKYVVALGALLIGMSQAQAATVSVGGFYDIDTALGVASISNEVGYLNAHLTGSPGYAPFVSMSGLLGYVFNGNTSEDRLTLNDGKDLTGTNPLASFQGTFGGLVYNNPGVDLYIFESGDAPVAAGDYSNNQYELVSASTSGTSGTWLDATILGFLYWSQLGGTDDRYGLYVYGIDLTDLGVADGASVASLYFGNTCGPDCAGGKMGGNNPDVEWIGGVAGAAVAAVPLPAGLPLLAGGLGLMALFGLRKKPAAVAQV